LYELVVVLREMNTTPTFRIYRNGVQQAALEAVFSADEWSIPLFRTDFLPFTSKIVEHSRYLLIAKSTSPSVLSPPVGGFQPTKSSPMLGAITVLPALSPT
jgi:hypothetical protein